MKHLTDEDRLKVIEGNASPEAAEHVKACMECAGEVRAMRQSMERLHEFSWPAPMRRRRAVAAPIFRWAAAAALFLAVGILVGRASGPSAAEIKAQVAQEVRESLRKELLASVKTAPPSQPAPREVLELLTEIREQQAANYLSLRNDLETLASNADARLQLARRQLMELAARTQ
jgi:hypothetical protein